MKNLELALQEAAARLDAAIKRNWNCVNTTKQGS